MANGWVTFSPSTSCPALKDGLTFGATGMGLVSPLIQASRTLFASAWYCGG